MYTAANPNFTDVDVPSQNSETTREIQTFLAEYLFFIES